MTKVRYLLQKRKIFKKKMFKLNVIPGGFN